MINRIFSPNETLNVGSSVFFASDVAMVSEVARGDDPKPTEFGHRVHLSSRRG
jgi:hypothetical protein